MIDNDFDCSEGVIKKMIGKVDLETLKWMRSKGLDFDQSTLCEAVELGLTDVMEWLCQVGCPRSGIECKVAAYSGDVRVIEWLVKNGFKLGENCIIEAVYNKKQQMMSWLFDHGCSLSQDAYEEIVSYAGSEILQTLLDKGYSPTENSYMAAVEAANMEALKWMEENRFRKPDDLLKHAIYRCNDLAVVGWLIRGGGCKLMADHYRMAIESMSFCVVGILYKHGCPWDDSTIDLLSNTDYDKMYIRDWFKNRDLLEDPKSIKNIRNNDENDSDEEKENKDFCDETRKHEKEKGKEKGGRKENAEKDLYVSLLEEIEKTKNVPTKFI
jgi:hypothetical protein